MNIVIITTPPVRPTPDGHVTKTMYQCKDKIVLDAELAASKQRAWVWASAVEAR